MADYFGVLDDGREQWCKGFAWHGNYVVCELEISTNEGARLQGRYFLLNTESGQASILSNDAVQSEWESKTGGQFPVLLERYEISETE